MAIEWGLAQPQNNSLAQFGVGMQLTQNLQDRRDQRNERNALLDIRRQEEARLGATAQATQAQHQQEQQRADLPILARLLDHATDETTYQQALAAAQQYHIDTSQAPRNFDPNWIGQQKAILQAVQSPAGQQALSAAGKQAADEGLRPGTPEFGARVTQIWQAESTKFLATQPGGGVASIAPGQPAQFVIQPNEGGQPAGAPVAPFDPNEWEVVGPGGGAGNSTGGFRP